MASSIDATKPIAGNPTTLSVRDNFAAAKSEIEALQAVDATKANIASPTFTGTVRIPSLTLGGTPVTSTAAELNILDGVTATAAELNILDGVTATAAELNILDGVTSTTAELNILDGVTSTTAELNILDGVTATATELNYNDITTLGTAQNSKAVTVSAGGAIDLASKTITNINVDSGAIDGTPIGASSASTGAFTTVSTTGAITQAGSTLAATYLPIVTTPNVVTGTTDTLAAADGGTEIVYTSASDVTITIPGTLAVGFQCVCTMAGTGNLIFTSSDNLNGGAPDLTLSTQWQSVYLLQYSEGNWLVRGDVA